MRVYHGSDHIIEKPVFHGGKRYNDFGHGFYMTESIDLAKEWACARNTDGYVNIYDLDMTGLNILNLTDEKYSILNWLAILTRYRSYWQRGSISEQAKTYLQEHFFIDLSSYDIMVGYRADDSYFSFAQDFVSGAISYRKLNEAMHLGKLGEQIVLKSEKAFSQIHYIDAVMADAGTYYEKKALRDRVARRQYRDTRSMPDELTDLYMIDIMRGGMTHGDPRL